MIIIRLVIAEALSHKFVDDEFYCVVEGRCYSNVGDKITLDNFTDEELLVRGNLYTGKVVHQPGCVDYQCLLGKVPDSEKAEWGSINSDKINATQQVANTTRRWFYSFSQSITHIKGKIIALAILLLIMIVVIIAIILNNQVYTVDLSINTKSSDWEGCVVKLTNPILYTNYFDKSVTNDDISGLVISDSTMRFEISSRQLLTSKDPLVLVVEVIVTGNYATSDTTYFDTTVFTKSEIRLNGKNSQWSKNISRKLTVNELIEKYKPLWSQLNLMSASAVDVQNAKRLLTLEDEGVDSEQIDYILQQIVEEDGLPVNEGIASIEKIKTKIEKSEWFFNGLIEGSLTFAEVRELYNDSQAYYFSDNQRLVFYWMTNYDVYEFDRYKRAYNTNLREQLTFMDLYNMY